MKENVELNNDLIEKLYTEIKETKEAVNNILPIREEIDELKEVVNNLAKMEKAHFESTKSNFERMDKKIDANFSYLDTKIDNTKDELVTDIVDMFDSFSATTSALIGNLERKIDNEMQERKRDISRVKGLNEYDKIILKDLESRISILEEESQPYEVN